MSDPARKINLCVVVDRTYGALLEKVAERLPIWIVDTPLNRRVFERIWHRRPAGEAINISAPGCITSFEVGDDQDCESNLLEIIPDIEVHYGESDRQYEALRTDAAHRYRHLPNGFGLDVIGLAVSDFIKSRLSDFGFGEFLPTASGFQAWIVRKYTILLQ
jgi:hypothetical protein